MQQRDVFVVGYGCTAIGTFGGSLKDVPLSVLATTAVAGALQRSGVHACEVGHVVMGNVIPTEPADAYISRVAAINAGMPHATPAFNVDGCAALTCRPSCRRRRRSCWTIRISRLAPARNR